MNKLTYVNGYGQQIEFPAFSLLSWEEKRAVMHRQYDLDQAIRLDPDELNGGATDHLFDDLTPEETSDSGEEV